MPRLSPLNGDLGVARVAALAASGEVLLSGTTRDLLDGSGLTFEPRGSVALMGISDDRPIFAFVRV